MRSTALRPVKVIPFTWKFTLDVTTTQWSLGTSEPSLPADAEEIVGLYFNFNAFNGQLKWDGDPNPIFKQASFVAGFVVPFQAEIQRPRGLMLPTFSGECAAGASTSPSVTLLLRLES